MNAPMLTAGMDIAHQLVRVPLWGGAHRAPMDWSEPSDICQSGAA